MGESQKARRKRERAAAELVARARKLRDYFSSHPSPQFEPNRDVASQIVEVMEGSNSLDTAAVASLLESLDGAEHHDGSGRFDFSLTVRSWIAKAEGRRR